MRNTTGRDSLVLDELDCGKWYRIRVPLGCFIEAEWLGFDGQAGILREEGSILTEYWPCNLLAQCTITDIPSPIEIIEPLHVAEERLDARDPQPLTTTDKQWFAALIIAGCAFWIALFLWTFGR